MARYLPAGVGLLLIVITALVQGHWSERWGKFPELQVYADQLKNVPSDIEDWHSTDREEPNKRILEAAGAVGSLSRDFTNEEGRVVSVFVVTGRLQDMFQHEPKRCYKAAGFEMQEDDARPQEIAVGDGATADFFYGRFVKSEATLKQDQVVYWSWSSNGKWLAPKQHKWEFRGQRALYKLYLMYTPRSADSVDHNPAVDFIPKLIPALNKAFEKATNEADRLSEQS